MHFPVFLKTGEKTPNLTNLGAFPTLIFFSQILFLEIGRLLRATQHREGLVKKVMVRPHTSYNLSGVATGGGGVKGEVSALDSEKIAKKSGKKRNNGEEKAKIREGSFTLPLLTHRVGYATARPPVHAEGT